MKEITQEQVDKACYLIAQKIKERSPNGFVLAAVSRGGLVPATIISHYLKHINTISCQPDKRGKLFSGRFRVIYKYL